MNPVRLVFLGTAELAATSLRALVATPWSRILAVVSQPDRPRGRSLQLQATPVKVVAHQVGLQVLQPDKARDPAFLQQLETLKPDLIVVAAYGQILPRAFLEIPTHGCLNVHTSLLPKYRGAAPIQWAILNGDTETGVTIMRVEEGLDTGPILASTSTPIGPEETAAQLHDRLAQLGADLLVRTVPDYVAGRIQPRPQPDEGVSYARKITKEDGHLKWNQPALSLANRVRGLAPWPGAYTFLPTQPRPCLLKIWEAHPCPGSGPVGTVCAASPGGIDVACAEGLLRLRSVQREGGRRMAAREFLAGHPLAPGTQLG